MFKKPNLKKQASIINVMIGLMFIVLGILGPILGGLGMLPTIIAIVLGVVLVRMGYNNYKKIEATEKGNNFENKQQKVYQNPSDQNDSKRKATTKPVAPEKPRDTADLLNIQNKSRQTYKKSEPKASEIKSTDFVPTGIKKPVQSFNNIFISYRRNDSADVTGRIYDKLLRAFERKQLFKDVDSIPLGVDFLDHLNKKVGECNVLIAIIGPYWVESDIPKGKKRIDDEKDFVRIEIEAALERKIPVIPVLVRGAKMPTSDQLPESLKGLAFRNGIPVRPDPDFHRDMERLIQGIKHHI